ncbi:MAG: hypothetical protein PHO55_12315 [Thiomonas arsenitoxydans]|nr:hypothetical protein [Thiomonas arsenitoxydans]CQR41757.1 hypothetical protein THICB3110326 [Thiomonas sp. CB3]
MFDADQKVIKKKRGGRPAGSLARIPPGHVNPDGLAGIIGLSPKTIPNLEERGDPRIPPLSPLAGFGAHRRMIWLTSDVLAHIESLRQARPQAGPGAGGITAPTAPAPEAPVNSVFTLAGGEFKKRRPGRPRKTSK